MNALPKQTLTVEEYLRWYLGQPAGRYELVNGTVVAQAPERARHNRCKAAAYQVLDRAIAKAKLPCTAFTDGMTVKIDEHTAREPDAAVQCGTKIDPDAIILDTPLIVVEVVSPPSERDDTGRKLAEYFSVPSILHYLIVDPFRPALIHHRRQAPDLILTQIHSSGQINLDPPGLVLDVADVLNSVA